MKQPAEYQNNTLSDVELSEARGGLPAGPGPHPPEDGRGRPLPTVPRPKPLPGETPPIIVIDRPLA